MEGGELFEGMDASFFDGMVSNEDLEVSEEVNSDNEPGFDPLTGEVYGEKDVKENKSEEDLKKELDFVNNEEAPEAGEGLEEGSYVKENEDIDEDTPDSEESPSSPLTSLTSALREDGVLSSLSDEEIAEIKSGGDLMDVIRKQIEKNEYSDLSDDQQEYLKAIRAGVPDEDYRQAKRTVDQISKIEPSSLEEEGAEEFRKQILVQDFLSKGFDQEDADKYASRSVDLGEDIEDSKKALTRLKATEEQKLSQLTLDAESKREKAEEDYNKKVNDLKLKVNNTKEVLPGVKINESTQGRIFENMTKTAGYDKNNNPVNAVVKNMIENQDYLIKLNYLHVLTDGLKDFSSLTGTVGSSAVNKLDKALQAQDAKMKSGSSHKGSNKKQEASGLINALDNIL